MRPLRLDLAGFTVFRDPTTVDFTDADYFALVGPTGSGKSTVLDGICFALYGTVPRWGGTRGIGNALAPSATEARVRLVFESAGARYVATRVVRRDARGNAKTASAGLQLMPPGFDATRLDTGMSLDDLGEVLAGTPAEMDRAIVEAVGLPYEQFTSCVVLPQGQFADFLHAKPATRQQILVNLLGLHVYEEIQARASARATKFEAQLTTLDQVLAGLADADDAAVDAAQARRDAMRELAAAVEAAVPGLRAAREAEEAAATARDGLDAELADLGEVRTPPASAAAAEASAAARAAAADTAAAVRAAEEHEEKVRGELAAAGESTALRLLLDRHAEFERLTEQADWFAGEVGVAEVEYRDAAAAAELARAAATGAEQLLEQARAEYAEAQRLDRAVALRAHLSTGDDCPVCLRPVDEVPPVPEGSAVQAAEATGRAARAAAEVASTAFRERDAVARKLESGLERKRAQHEHHLARLTEVRDGLADSPGVEALRARLAELTRLQRRLEDAGSAVRAAREQQRRAQAAAEAAEDQQRRAWRAFDAARDAVARFTPPPADRDDLAAAWAALVIWAGEQRGRRERALGEADAAVMAAHQATLRAYEAVADLFTEAGVPVPRVGVPTPRASGPGRPGSAAAGSAASGSAASGSGASGSGAAGLGGSGLGGSGSGAAGSGAAGSGAGRAVAGAAADAELIRAAAVAAERAQAAWQRLVDRREQARDLAGQRATLLRDSRVAKALAGHLRANNFERWLLEEALDLLVDGASRILRELTGGQYDLVHDKGEFFVVDHHDAGLRRGVRTLSGGETFQASLALALALSEQLAGMSTTAASLESIVLDEGFGTLDAATLDVVAATLENLAARGDRMVGVVTHVNALAERVPVRFEVHKDARTAHVDRVGL
ncbi:exonuclease SbcC [Krasilnikovia cinnamomea]|uniref:Nuclease SbcCD subunit C n=1 Tax=Krasilnikovia cinnamomea TaxID=349313 RepID=A0A4Q7ZFJ8_9ACTN|nr:SMC family ATPase [Krasilnikovia cinnamomea]RZU49552.1 exonuclease SbcC [Krasilnikovia cinnamomea]